MLSLDALTYSNAPTLTTTPKLSIDHLPGTRPDTTLPTAGSGPIEVEELPGPDLEKALRLFQKSWDLRGQIGDDARDIARTLKTSMKEILSERPDLADVAFDFRLENGRIKVVDTRLEGADLQWLEAKLNGNFLLVDKVKAFRSHVVELAQTNADLRGLAGADAAELGQQLDEQVQFMRLFRQLGDQVQGMLLPTGTYRTQAGEVFDVREPLNTAHSFLPFQARLAALEDGLNYTREDGRDIGIGLRVPNAYFSIGLDLNKYLPDFGIDALGFHAEA